MRHIIMTMKWGEILSHERTTPLFPAALNDICHLKTLNLLFNEPSWL